MPRIKWSFKKYVKFLENYNFTKGHVKGSHFFYNGRIKGVDRVVQVIFSQKEKDCQSNRTIKMGIKNSGISKELFEKWDKDKSVDESIIY